MSHRNATPGNDADFWSALRSAGQAATFLVSWYAPPVGRSTYVDYAPRRRSRSSPRVRTRAGFNVWWLERTTLEFFQSYGPDYVNGPEYAAALDGADDAARLADAARQLDQACKELARLVEIGVPVECDAPGTTQQRGWLDVVGFVDRLREMIACLPPVFDAVSDLRSLGRDTKS